jgi:DNA-binding MarR family transcriptional regulator
VTDSARLPAALRHRTSFVLVRLAAVARQHCADVLAEAGLGQHQHAILCCLDEFGPAFQKDIAGRLGIDSGDIVAFVDKLQVAGLITRERDTRDRRRQLLSITEDGRRELKRIEQLFDEAEPGALGALSREERAELHRMATRVLQRMAPQAWSGTD